MNKICSLVHDEPFFQRSFILINRRKKCPKKKKREEKKTLNREIASS
uniref:Uncharacterized protein n=1 Tax=Arundo donax TaxID=35708 RepID=A0A0A9E6R7_ARUDO